MAEPPSAAAVGRTLFPQASPPWLTASELQSATSKKQPSAQARVLRALGIPFKRRPDGKLLVGREAVAAALAGTTAPKAASNGLAWSKNE